LTDCRDKSAEAAEIPFKEVADSMRRIDRCRLWLLGVVLLGYALPARAGQIDPYLPNDTEIVILVNVRQVLGSPLVARNLDQIRQGLQKVDELQKTLTALGFDLLRDLDSVTASSSEGSSPDRAVIVVHGRFDVPRFQAKAAEVARDMGNLLKVVKAGEYTLYEIAVPNDPRPIVVGLVDGTTIVASPNRDRVIDAFDVRAGKKRPAPSATFRQIMELADPTLSVALVAAGSALAKGVPHAEQIQYLAGGVRVADDIRTDFTIATRDEESARTLTKMLEEGIPQGKYLLTIVAANRKELAPFVQILETLKVAGQGSVVTVRGQVTKEWIEQLNKKN
jgi:hypothetical protein